ncbi:MAG: nucleotidyltransferase family protein [Roseburia sp.]|nr:nucleotidyltransferase family protein [Roseburia sp.]
MNVKLDGNTKWLCLLVKRALTASGLSEKEQELLTGADINGIWELAERHRVLALVYDVLEGQACLGEKERDRLQRVAASTVRQSYRLLFLSRQLIDILERADIPVLVLKGSGVAAWYPVPEYRKSGDIDLCFRDRESALEALSLLQKEGWHRKEEEHASHHICCSNEKGIDVELHIRLAEAFDSGELNRKLEELTPVFLEERCRREVMGVALPVPRDAHQALSLLLHMLHHFLRAGFGLRLLCDWVVFWNGVREKETAAEFRQLARDCGLEGFAEAVTLVCERYLGLKRNKVYPAGKGREGSSLKERFSEGYGERLLTEIMEAGEFGGSAGDRDRMVALREKSLAGYFREFHHQMRINYPGESAKPYKWPTLWMKTLFVFLKNNRRLNRASLRGILRKAGERAELVEEMRLFER